MNSVHIDFAGGIRANQDFFGDYEQAIRQLAAKVDAQPMTALIYIRDREYRCDGEYRFEDGRPVRV